MEHAPWIGDRYADGVDGQRLLLFGFSHYGSPAGGEDRADMTEFVIRTWALGAEIPFFNALASYFGRNNTADFLAQVAFANVLPRSVGDEEDKFSAGGAMQAEAGERVRRVIRSVDPDKVIVFTAKGWQLFPHYDDRDTGGWLPVAGNAPVEFGGYRRTRPGFALAYGVRHPMMAPWQMMYEKVSAIMAS